MVVEPDSAMIGIGREETSSIPESHSGMTKFGSKGDIGFKRVSAQIQRWVRALPLDLPDVLEDTSYSDCLSSLDSATMGIRIKSVTQSHPKTFHWIFNDEVVSFSKWLQDSDGKMDSIYWIQGKPGSGKSTLMKFAMGDVRTGVLLGFDDIPYTIAGFFFHDRGSEDQKSIPGMLRGLLHSILTQCSQLRQFVPPIYADLVVTQKSKTPDWDFESLTLAFESIVKQRQVKTRLCLFLDALDEPSGDKEHLVNLLENLLSEADENWVKVKFCVASRPWDVFLDHFSKNPGFKIHEYTAGDILAYTSGVLHDAAPKDVCEIGVDSKRAANLDSLAQKISERSQGVFIWVRIVVEEISRGIKNRTPYFVLTQVLESMPEELGDLYEHTLRRIDPQLADEAHAMLQIALCAFKPLPLDTFVNTTSFAVWGHVPGPGDESSEDMVQRVISRSGGLLEVQQVADIDISAQAFLVQFIHQTVKEFVQKRKDDLGLHRMHTGGTGYEYIFIAAAANSDPWADDIGQDVFEYARFTSLSQESISERHPSIRVLATDLSAELDRQLAGMESLSQEEHELNKGVRFPKLSRLDWWLEKNEHFLLYRNIIKGDDVRICCVAMAHGLSRFVEPILRAFEPAAKDTSATALGANKLIGCLLWTAAVGPRSSHVSRKEMLRFLFDKVDKPADWYFEPPTDGVGVANFGLVTVLELLITNNNPYHEDDNDRISAVQFMLERGANPNELLITPNSRHNLVVLGDYDIFEVSLFHQVIRQESAQMVRLFIEYGATIPEVFKRPVITLWDKFPLASGVLKELARMIDPKPGRSRGTRRLMLGPYSIHDEEPVSGLSYVEVFALSTAIHAVAYGASGAMGIIMQRWRKAYLAIVFISKLKRSTILRRLIPIPDSGQLR